MITEARFRLLRKDETSLSGYRIVGFIRMNGGKVYAGREPEPKDLMYQWRCIAGENDTAYFRPYIDADALEPGIKVGETWCYEGDIVHCPQYSIDDNDEYVLSQHGLYWILRGNGTTFQAEPFTPTGRTIHDKETP